MTTLAQKFPVKALFSKLTLLWLAALVVLVALLVLLTKAVSDNPSASQDIIVMNWIVGWDLPGLTTFFDVVSSVAHTQIGAIYGSLAIIVLLLLGKNRPAIVFTAVGLSIAVVALAADHSLGLIVDRGRPLDPSHLAFPAVILMELLCFSLLLVSWRFITA